MGEKDLLYFLSNIVLLLSRGYFRISITKSTIKTRTESRNLVSSENNEPLMV